MRGYVKLNFHAEKSPIRPKQKEYPKKKTKFHMKKYYFIKKTNIVKRSCQDVKPNKNEKKGDHTRAACSANIKSERRTKVELLHTLLLIFS